MSWNLWLDDERDPKDWLVMSKMWGEPMHPETAVYMRDGYEAEDFVWVKNAPEAIALCQAKGLPAYMALDHDLGSHTVFDFLHWLTENAKQQVAWHCHSANWSGSRNVDSYLESFNRSLSLPE